MIYAYENCSPGTKVYDEAGQEISHVVAVYMETAKVCVQGDSVRLNAKRTPIVESTLSFERIEIAKFCQLTNRPKEFRCYGLTQ